MKEICQKNSSVWVYKGVLLVMSCWNNDLMTKDPQPHGPFLDLFSFCCKPKRFPHDPRDPCGFRKGFDTKKATRWCFCTLCKRYSYTRNWAKLAIHCLANLETEMKVRRFVPKYIYITYYIIYTYIYNREEVTKMISPTSFIIRRQVAKFTMGPVT